MESKGKATLSFYFKTLLIIYYIQSNRKLKNMKTSKYPIVFSICTLIILVVSGIFTRDTYTWVLEVVPIFIGFSILFFTYGKFPLTRLLYVLITIHFVILAVGGVYTYAKVPLGFWMQDWFHFQRNHYDRIGHFAQGFIPAMLVREILIRTSPLKPGKWLSFLVVCVCLAISACYEFIEWFTAVSQGASAEAFLGTQGDVWDAQWDMLFATIGAISALILLSKWHNKQLVDVLK
jgi:putative membrane protein